eukprot:TRINITY_DN11861_c0_g1_i1.p2 TRINITY_DN11861_c0_g1~~TRINITY_DN11861_c0_g1_i1.p2  ORF type:complete len:107 (-),score=38.93 TRINITY_DN11861_c0_g1_i1:327-623(-)
MGNPHLQMDGDGSQYFAPADGHFNQEGLYTGDPGGDGYQDLEQGYDGQFAEFSTAGDYQNTNEFSPLSHVLGDGGWASQPWLLMLRRSSFGWGIRLVM